MYDIPRTIMILHYRYNPKHSLTLEPISFGHVSGQTAEAPSLSTFVPDTCEFDQLLT